MIALQTHPAAAQSESDCDGPCPIEQSPPPSQSPTPTPTPTDGGSSGNSINGLANQRFNQMITNGTAGPQPVGNTIHGGVGLRINY